MENEDMKIGKEKEKSKGKTITIIILILLVLGMGGYIAYDKYFSRVIDDKNKTSERKAIKNFRHIIKSSKNCNGIF